MSFQTLLSSFVAGDGEMHSADGSPRGSQWEHTGLLALFRATPLPVFFPFPHSCSPEVTSPARRAFTGAQEDLEFCGLSHAARSPWRFLLRHPAHSEGWSATSLFPPALSMWLTPGECCSSSSIKALAWLVGSPLPYKTRKPCLSSSVGDF